MTVSFRIESVRLDTTSGAVSYEFPGDLTVLAGHTGVGKTTLLELIKYALGGDGQLAPVARDHVTDVHVSIHVGAQRYQLSRWVRRCSPCHGASDRPRDRRSAGGPLRRRRRAFYQRALARSNGPGGRFARRGPWSTEHEGWQRDHVQRHLPIHVRAAIGDEPRHRGQPGELPEPEAQVGFEILFGSTSGDLLQKRSRINTLRAEIDAAEKEAEIVTQFLTDTGLTSRFDAQIESDSARADEADAKAALVGLQDQLADVVDRHTQVLRDLLSDAENTLAEARSLASEMKRQRDDYETERRRVKQDIDRLARMASAGLRLANIEFSVVDVALNVLTSAMSQVGRVRCACRLTL